MIRCVGIACRAKRPADENDGGVLPCFQRLEVAKPEVYDFLMVEILTGDVSGSECQKGFEKYMYQLGQSWRAGKVLYGRKDCLLAGSESGA